VFDPFFLSLFLFKLSSPGENAKEEQETSSLRFSQRGRFGGDDDACIIIILARLLLVVLVHLLGPVDSEEDEVALVVDDDAPKKAALLLLGGPDNILLLLSLFELCANFSPKAREIERDQPPVSKEKRVLYKGKGKREEKGKELARGKKTYSLSLLFPLFSPQ
jgi:hypothetical protein